MLAPSPFSFSPLVSKKHFLKISMAFCIVIIATVRLLHFHFYFIPGSCSILCTTESLLWCITAMHDYLLSSYMVLCRKVWGNYNIVVFKMR